MRAGEQDLGAHHAGAFGTVGKLLLCGIVYGYRVDGDDCGVQDND